MHSEIVLSTFNISRRIGCDVHAGSSSAPRSDLFKPGRTIYEFNLDPRDHSNVPTTVTRSLEDIPQFEVYLVR